MWSYIDPLEKNPSEVRVSHSASPWQVQFTVLQMGTSAVWRMFTTESKTTAKCKSFEELSDCIDPHKRPFNIEADLRHLTPPIPPPCLHARALLNLLQNSQDGVHSLHTTRRQLVQRECRLLTLHYKAEVYRPVILSKPNSQQKFIETLKSLSAITGIFFNHYHSSQTACHVLKLIQVLSVWWLSQRWLSAGHWYLLIYLT